ncbi:hypothetical protein [uncultured Shewanella sp.]|uniref:hypothetical protein n=1 Tax=uncultured Shewanella sp. TaxID=173975 RepID=UPI00261553E6|nr:hypothetical protein [uncultured Shewanella sp.]
MTLSFRVSPIKKMIAYWLLLIGSLTHLTALASTSPYYIASIGDSITAGVDGNNQQSLDNYTYSNAIIQGKLKAKQTYQSLFVSNTTFAPGGYREALVQLMCDPYLSITFTTDPTAPAQTVNNDPSTSIASHFQCDARSKKIHYIDRNNQLHAIKFLGNTTPNPFGTNPNNQAAPGIDYFTDTQATDSNGKTITVKAPYFANQGYTLCNSTHNCPFPIASLFQQAKTPLPDKANIFAITLAGTNDIMLGFDTFNELKSDLLHFITRTLPANLNPNSTNTLFHIVSPITPVTNSGACKMFTKDGCADLTYNRYIQNKNVSPSAPSLTHDVLINDPKSHISIAGSIIPVLGYNNNVHPDLQNYLYLGYNIANVLVKNFQIAATTAS